ncbi:GTP-binding protein [Microbacterium sp. VKM Ac-2923]|uniref:GTP-binding protein n=1 Tax=Microbacterium sp. VKM Ac-2923 TaxID=2929476 RepID=UPI001FB546A0|nr:GTP-binding protein [Microbacterium sp. VKM Ac-2923]MCJ1706479.1 GTP-binding protein [Microbacterium sp. VKM Ac-2923]
MSRTIVITGVCAPERRAYAERTAIALDRSLHLLRYADLRSPHALPHPRPRTDAETVVVDLGSDVDLIHAIGARGGAAVEAVCVVDARHMIGDLLDDAPLVASARSGDTRSDVGARARQAALALELATRIVWINWEQVPTPALAVQMALASHLNPTAIVRLSRDPVSDLRSDAVHEGEILERAGWVHALNGEHDPYMRDNRVMTVHYEQLRPFHPARLSTALDRLDEGAAGRLVRSAGFCRLASRPGVLARWEHVGSAMWIEPLGTDDGRMGMGQEIVFTGLDLSTPKLAHVLDQAALTDDELAAGPTAWMTFDDPLPAWPAVDSSIPDAAD